MAKKKKSKPKTSYTQILNIGYGVLNPIRDTLTGKNFDGSDVSSIDLVRNMYKSFYSANTFTGTGPYVGIVLRDEGMISDGIIDASSWVSGPFANHIRVDEDVDAVDPKSTEGGVSKEKVIHLPQLRQLRVRIPEIHSSLPIPSYLPMVSQRGKDYDTDHRIINQYPVFVGQNSKISSFQPSPGDLVWVDFQNKNTLEGGIYIGPVDQGNAKTPASKKGTTYVGGGKKAFDKSKCIEAGGTSCEVLVPDIDYEDAVLSIKPGKPFLPPGFNLDLVSFIDIKVDESGGKEGTNFKQMGSEGYKSILAKRGSFITNRPKFLGYGLIQAEQTSNAYGNRGVHKLVTPRLDALNEFWGHFYNAFQNGGVFGNVTADNFEYSEALGSGKVKPYERKFRVSLGIVEKDDFKEISPSKFKSYLISKVNNMKPKKDDKGNPIESQLTFNKIAYPGLSNHATGLAFDLTNNGMKAARASHYGYDKAKKSGKHIPQYASIGWKFMAKYGWLFGFYAYNTEVWHWELKVPRNSWKHSQPFCGIDVSAKKKYRNGFQHVLSNGYKPLTEEEKAAIINSIPIPEQTDENINNIIMQHEEERLSTTDQTAPVTLRDIIENEKIVPDEKLRDLYRAELTLAFGGTLPLDMQFPYCVFVEEKENRRKPRRELSSMQGSRTFINKYLNNAGIGIGFEDIKFIDEAEKQALLTKLNNAETEKTNPEKNFFTLTYFNVKGGLREQDLREVDADRLK
tara:strand:- start:26675 stop:28885 length:2211 start_codon:yes stop_codon:yes gene_type:complete